jgi:hypothetical protein
VLSLANYCTSKTNILMTRTIIFVGYIRQSYLEYFAKENFNIGLFADPDRESYIEGNDITAEEKIDFVFPVNLESKISLEKSLAGVRFKPDTLLLCLNDRYLLATAYIAHFLGLKQKQSLPISLAENGTDKMYQRKLFKKKFPEISPAYKTIKTFHGAYLFSRKYGFPLIIKPANLSQSQLVNVCENLEDLIIKGSYVLDHVAEVYKKNQVHRKPIVGIEEYIQGRQYSVDSYVSLKGEIIHTPVCEQALAYDEGSNNFETLYSSYTDSLTKKEENIIFETVSKAIKALNIKGNPTHTEVRLTPEGSCKIVEVNIRTGGYRADLLKYSYEINHPENVINTYLGKEIKAPNKLLKHSTAPQFWSKEAGTLEEVIGLEEVKKLESFQKVASSVQIGDKVGPADLGYPRAAFALLAHEDKKTLFKDLKKTRELIKFKVKPLVEPADEDSEEDEYI